MADGQGMRAIRLLALLLAIGMPMAAPAAPAGLDCADAAAQQLRACLRRVTAATRKCFRRAGRPCTAADVGRIRTLHRTESRIAGACRAPDAVSGAGHGALLDAGALGARLREACDAHDQSLTARAFGGPQGVVRAAASASAAGCLDTAAKTAARLVDRALRLRSRCVMQIRRGRGCDADAVEAAIDTEASRAADTIAAACADLRGLVALDVGEFVARARAQERCLVPAVFGDAGPFALDCGPRPSIPVAPRATPTQVVLDESVWGTRCGNGSPYAFWYRLAPEGAPADRVVVYMQGGGVCIGADDCPDVPAGRFTATDNTLITGGIMSNTSADNPYRDWTKVYLPYCTQDIHVGGGRTTVFPGVTVHRYGGVNVRAALRYVRDVLWTELDATTADGYRPERVRAIFSGGSAGAFGAVYHYHWMLDDLRWPRTTSVPDAGLGLGNGSLNGVAGIGILIVGDNSWGARSLLPPYCDEASCAVVPTIAQASAHRLEMLPEQQILHVSNQVDATQSSTTRFPSLRSWIDALRLSYCQHRGRRGIHYFLPALSDRHTLMVGANYTVAAAGEPLNAWLGGLIDDPAGMRDRVDEGSLVASHGVMPFPCALDPL